ncbi:MAG TPA: fructose-bisphosphate aldolase [Gammaproteobacteria bacterium]|jgi:fructose-bisphosphate aldolase class II|nr:fructose-bisphosphate aldolase [Gammaproteobacteria bacterium]
MIAGLGEVLTDAKKDNRAIAGLVCLGWEDMRAYVKAAELENQPVIIQAGPSCRRHTPLRVLGPMMRYLAEEASVPVVVHLDHGANIDECRQAIASGFSSVMYDGSRLPLQDNIEATRTVVELAHRQGISVEGEIGFVGYAEGETSATTDPQEAAIFAKETGIDAMAISVGNVHLQLDSETELDERLINEIQELTDIPLVIHGGSGVPAAQRSKLAATTNICKYNIGTELRVLFGSELRNVLVEDAQMFDRIKILGALESRLVEGARVVLRSLLNG